MRLTEVSFNGWRNLTQMRIDCDAPLIVVHGDNGQGKSNILEAVHVLGTLKSFRESRARRWIQHGEKLAQIGAKVQTPHGLREISWGWSDGVRRLTMDGAVQHEIQMWFQAIRAVVFCPEDGAIVRGEPDRRRKFLDRAAFTAHPVHLRTVQDYRRVLGHKRALLTSGFVDPMQLDIFDAELARTGSAVISRRLAVLDELREAFNPMHNAIAGTGTVDLQVQVSGLGIVETMSEQELCSKLLAAISEKRSAEIERRQVLVGPHRDDLDIRIDGRPARNFASQGQARSIVLGLKLAELEAAHQRGEVPLFLLDDLTSELDQGRRTRLIEILRELDGQVWVTTTDPAYLGDLSGVQSLNLHVQSGRVEV